MDNLVTTAIIGTGQAGTQELGTGTPIDALSSQLDGETERKLLLTAGAWGLYRQAGQVTTPAPEAPPPAEPEELAPCTALGRLLLERLLENQSPVLRELFTFMQQAKQRLPYEVLPTALTYGAQSKKLRSLLIPLLGKRGIWLSQFNPAWSWTKQFIHWKGDRLPDYDESLWQHGTLGQRCELLEHVRSTDPAKARDWLAAVWKQEKAEARSDLLNTFSVGLSADDEPFLEQAQNDRSSIVRSTAVLLLRSIPTSALLQRMQERADTMLDYKKGNLLQKDVFTLTLPEKIDEQWTRDGIEDSNSRNAGRRTQWFIQVLAHVPPRHWEERFETTPEQLIEALNKNEWKDTLLEGWALAATHYSDSQWIVPIMNALHATKNPPSIFKSLESGLLSVLPSQEAEKVLLSILMKSDDLEKFYLAKILPRPWGKTFANFYLYKMRNYIANGDTHTSRGYHHLSSTLKFAAKALPVACFDAALQEWDIPEQSKNHWWSRYWQEQIAEFTEIITLRKRIHKEFQS